jgi:hypothetical protein
MYIGEHSKIRLSHSRGFVSMTRDTKDEIFIGSVTERRQWENLLTKYRNFARRALPGVSCLILIFYLSSVSTKKLSRISMPLG